MIVRGRISKTHSAVVSDNFVRGATSHDSVAGSLQIFSCTVYVRKKVRCVFATPCSRCESCIANDVYSPLGEVNPSWKDYWLFVMTVQIIDTARKVQSTAAASRTQTPRFDS